MLNTKRVNLVVAQSMVCKYIRMQKRARWLYILLCRHKLKKNPRIILTMAKNGIERGLWSACDSSGRSARVSILGILYKIELKNMPKPQPLYYTWGQWLDDNNWDSYTGRPTRW